MLMMIIAHTHQRAAQHLPPFDFSSPRRSLESVKTALRLHVATLHAEAFTVDESCSLMLAFVGRGNSGENMLAGILAAHDQDSNEFMAQHGVIAVYTIPSELEEDEYEDLVNVLRNKLELHVLADDCPYGNDQVLPPELFDLPEDSLLVGSPLSSVAANGLLGLVTGGLVEGLPYNPTASEFGDDVAEVETQSVNVNEVETDHKDTIAMTTQAKMTNRELMVAAQKLYADLKSVSPKMGEMAVQFSDPARISRYCSLGMSDLSAEVLNELSERSTEVARMVAEMADLTANQDFEPAPVADVSLAAIVEDDNGDIEEEFTEVDTEAFDAEQIAPLVGEVADEEVPNEGSDEEFQPEETELLDLTDPEVLEEKMPAIAMLVRGELDEVDTGDSTVLDTVALFSLNFLAEQDDDFNAFNAEDVSDAEATGQLVNVMSLLQDADWLTTASFNELYDLDNALTDLLTAVGIDVFATAEENEEEDDYEEDEDEELESEELENEEGEYDDADAEAPSEDACSADDLDLVALSVHPRLVLNVVADYNGHVYDREQRQAMTNLPLSNGKTTNIGLGINAASSTQDVAAGFYLRPIRMVSKALSTIANASVLLPVHAIHNSDAEQIAAAIARAVGGATTEDMLAGALEALSSVDTDEDGRVLLGFGSEDGEDDSYVALSDLCHFSTHYNLIESANGGPITVEITSVLSMRLPLLSAVRDPETFAHRLMRLSAKAASEYGIEVCPAITFNAADRMFIRHADYADKNIDSMIVVADAMVATTLDEDEGDWGHAIFATKNAIGAEGLNAMGVMYGVAEDYIPLADVADIDVFAESVNDAAAIFLTTAGESMFHMGGDCSILITPAHAVDEDDDLEVESESEE